MNFDYDGIISQYENGNLREFDKQINKMNKKQLVNFVSEWHLQGKEFKEIFRVLEKWVY